MKQKWKRTREWLNMSSRKEFLYVLKEAMLSKTQRLICIMRRNQKSNVYISLKLHCDLSTINREVTKIYKRTSRIIFKDKDMEVTDDRKNRI